LAGRIRLSEFGGVTNGSGLEGIVKSALDALDEGGTLIFDAIRYGGNVSSGFEYAIYQPILVEKSVFIQADSPEISFVNKSAAEEIFRVRPNKDNFFIGFDGLKFISGTKAITISGSYRLAPNSRIQNLNFWHQTNRSLEVQVPEINLHIEKVHFRSNSVGAYFESQTNHDNLSIEKCKFEDNTSIGVHFVKPSIGGISGSVYVNDTEFISNNQALVVDNVRYYESQVEYNLNQANYVLSGASIRLTGSGAGGGGGGGVTDHGALTGLLDDDHPQYILASGSRPMGGNLNMGGYNITNPGTVDGRDLGIDGATLDAHIIDYANPHRTSLVNIESGTLAQLNAKISDADLVSQASFISFTASYQTFTSSIGSFTSSLAIPISGSPTIVTNLTSAYNSFWSAGSVRGFEITDNGNGTVSIAQGEAMLRSAANHSATLYSVSVPATASLAMTNDSPNFIFVDWNNGTPIITATTSNNDFNCLDKCLLWSITREGSLLYSVDGRSMNIDSNSKHRRVLLESEVFRKATNGSMIGNPSGRYLSLTSGTFFYALNRITHDSYDTSVAGTANPNVFKYYYRNGSGGWLSATLQKEVNNGFYDNGTGVTASLGTAKYRTDYAYLLFDGGGTSSQFVLVLGQNESNSAADAEVYPTPSSLPPAIMGAGTLLGQIVIRQGATTLSTVKSAFDTVFRPVLITSHNNLSDLQGGGVGEYYHLTLAQTGHVSAIPAFTSSINAFTASSNATSASFAGQLGPLTASVVRLDSASGTFRTELSVLNAASATFRTELTALTATVVRLDSASGTFRTELNRLDSASGTFRAELTALTATTNRLNAASATFRSELDSLNILSPVNNSISAAFIGFSGSHGSRHLSGAVDAINAQNLGASGISENHLLISNAAGGWRTVHSSSVGGGGGVTDHGALTGLGDNDHPHYVLTSTFGAFTSSVNATTASLQSFSGVLLAASATFRTELTALTATVTRLDSASASFAANRPIRLIAARGWSASNYLKTAPGTCTGSTACTIAGIIVCGEVQSGDADTSVRTLIGGGTMFSEGYMLGYTALRPAARFADGAYSKLGTDTYHPSWAWAGTTDGYGYQLANLKTLVMALVLTASNLSVWVNGTKWRTITRTGVTVSANGLWLGTHAGGGEHAEDCGIVGAGYADIGFTDNQVISWTRACMLAGDMVNGGGGFHNLWSFKQSGLTSGSSVPSTIEDMIGTIDLTLSGTLSVDFDYPEYL
jgi:hypothetical protein